MALVVNSWRHGGIIDVIEQLYALFGDREFINLDIPETVRVRGHHHIPRYLYAKGALRKAGKRTLPDGRTVLVWTIRADVIEYLALLKIREHCPDLYIKETGGAWCTRKRTKCNMSKVRSCMKVFYTTEMEAEDEAHGRV